MESHNTGLYRRLRAELLAAAGHHRKSARHPAFLSDCHERELQICRRQLGALRQAYKRTRAAAAWDRYRSQLG